MSVAAAAPRPVRPARAALAAASGAVGLAVLVAAGVAIALAAADGDHGFLVPALVGAHAEWVVGPLQPLAIRTPISTVVDELLVMTLAYAAVIALVAHVRLRAVAAAVVVLHAAFLLAPPLLSTDVFNYVDAARLMAIHHLDPYTSVPAVAKHDPIYVFTRWRHTHSVYGPVFTLASRPLGLLTPAAAMWAFKVAVAASSLGCSWLVWWIARRVGSNATRALAVFGLNPMLLVWTVGGAHNDLLMLLVLLGGVALMLGGRPAAAGAALVVAVAVKASAGLALPFLVLGAPRRGRVLAGILGAAAAVGVVAFLAFADHAQGLVPTLLREQRLVSRSLPAELAHSLGRTTVGPDERLVLHVVLVVALLVLAVWVWRGGDALTATGWAFVALVATSTWTLGWYTVWPLAFAAVSRNRRLLIATIALQLSYAVLHVPLT